MILQRIRKEPEELLSVDQTKHIFSSRSLSKSYFVIKQQSFCVCILELFSKSNQENRVSKMSCLSHFRNYFTKMWINHHLPILNRTHICELRPCHIDTFNGQRDFSIPPDASFWRCQSPRLTHLLLEILSLFEVLLWSFIVRCNLESYWKVLPENLWLVTCPESSSVSMHYFLERSCERTYKLSALHFVSCHAGVEDSSPIPQLEFTNAS
jgi:hypothetical protein